MVYDPRMARLTLPVPAPLLCRRTIGRPMPVRRCDAGCGRPAVLNVEPAGLAFCAPHSVEALACQLELGGVLVDTRQ